MKKVLLPFLIFCVQPVFAQVIPLNTDWTKEDRNTVYQDALNTTQKNRTLTTEQRESLALCYLDEITKKYNKKDYIAKIDIEVKRITEATLAQCAKNIGVELTVKKMEVAPDATKTDIVRIPKKVNEGNFKAADLVGTWKDNNSKMFFNADNTYLIKLDTGESGGGSFSINNDKNIVLDNVSTLKVLSFDGQTLKYQQTVIAKTKFFGLKKIAKTDIYTAEKID